LGGILTRVAHGGPAFSVGGNASDTLAAADSVTRTYKSDGNINDTPLSTGVAVDVGDWVAPLVFAPGGYYIRFHVVSGSAASGTFDTDLALSSNRSFSVQKVGSGSAALVVTVTIKSGSGGATLKSGNVTLTANVP
jgi:hypothetical protein